MIPQWTVPGDEYTVHYMVGYDDLRGWRTACQVCVNTLYRPAAEGDPFCGQCLDAIVVGML